MQLAAAWSHWFLKETYVFDFVIRSMKANKSLFFCEMKTKFNVESPN